jgi:hypothetical protein
MLARASAKACRTSTLLIADALTADADESMIPRASRISAVSPTGSRSASARRHVRRKPTWSDSDRRDVLRYWPEIPRSRPRIDPPMRSQQAGNGSDGSATSVSDCGVRPIGHRREAQSVTVAKPQRRQLRVYVATAIAGLLGEKRCAGVILHDCICRLR